MLSVRSLHCIWAIRDEIYRLRFAANLDDDLYIPARDLADRATWMTRLHAPISSLGFSLTDEQRHNLLSICIGRPIASALDLTKAEIMAVHKVISSLPNREVARQMIGELLSEPEPDQSSANP